MLDAHREDATLTGSSAWTSGVALNMPENSIGQGVTAGTKRRSSAGLNSSAGIRKQTENEILEASDSASASHTQPATRSVLCSFCSEHVFHKNCTLGRLDDLDCPSCELITNASPNNSLVEARDDMRKGAIFTHSVHAKSSVYTDVVIHNRKDDREYGTLKIRLNDTKVPNDIPESIDFIGPREWLRRCEEVHGVDCDQRNVSSRHTVPIDAIFVDVERNCITRKTTMSRYCALSYVWGGNITATTMTQNIQALQQPGSLVNGLQMPKTVLDAMVITRKMGLRYLWVDCLSVIQNSSKKHQDIADMDVIFSQAVFTIVAACSSDADSGLAGVNPETRRPRVLTKTQGDHTLKLELPSEKFPLLFRTTYVSRGWTFQELLMSRRVFFVTEHQIMFHCGFSRRSESYPEEEPHDNGQFGLGNIDLRLRRSESRSNEEILQSYSAMVAEYCPRRLSFQSDIENAFAGLASIVEQWCEGCPVVRGLMTKFFGCSLLWAFDRGQDFHSCYPREEIGKRREGFPSWSWVGWVACVTNLAVRSIRLHSLIKDIEITDYGERQVSKSLIVIDQSTNHEGAEPIGQHIRINFEPAKISSTTLAFDAERMDWTSFSVRHTNDILSIFSFSLLGNSAECGFLSIAPDEIVIDEVLDLQLQPIHEVDSDCGLVRLYQSRLKHWDGRLSDSLQVLLDDIEEDGVDNTGFAKELRTRLQGSTLLHVMLVRRRGIFCERIGSGLMFEESWPSAKSGTEIRAYQERITLI